MLNLNLNYLEQVKKILKNHAKNQVVWAYGSRVNGRAHQGSDLDLVIMNNLNQFTLDDLLVLRAAFSESNLPILVDVLNWQDMPLSFDKQAIEQLHEVIQY